MVLGKTENEFPSLENPPWNSFIAVLVWLASVFSIFLFQYAFLLPYLLSKNLDLKSSVAVTDVLKNDSTAVILNLIAVFPAHLLTLFICWLVITNFKRYSFSHVLGLKRQNISLFSTFFLIVGFNALAISLFYYFPEKEHELMRILRSSPQALYLTALIAVSTAPIVEEIVYRGILYSAFQKKFGVVPAITLVSLLFALVHFPQYYPSYLTISLILLLSLILTIVRAYTGSLLPCIMIHFCHNTIQASILILQNTLEKIK